MIGVIDNALDFIINTIFTLFLYLLLIRLILVYVGAYYYDPLTQFIVKFTDFCIKPLRKIIPNIKRIETATLILALVISIIKYALIFFLTFGIPNILGLLIIAIADVFNMIINLMTYAIIAEVILSWIQPSSPAHHTLMQFASPVMSPIKRLIPPINGIDITPIPALILLQLTVIVIISPLMAYGQALAF